MFNFSYILVFAASTACVFGIASLFEETPVRVATTVRLGGTPNRWLAYFGRGFRLSEKERLSNRVWLLQAGFDSPEATQNYKVVRMLLMVTLPLGVAAVLPFVKPDVSANDTLVAALAAAAIGLLAPLMYVRSRRARNQQAVRDGLPDALDLLLVCSEAGLGQIGRASCRERV